MWSRVCWLAWTLSLAGPWPPGRQRALKLGLLPAGPHRQSRRPAQSAARRRRSRSRAKTTLERKTSRFQWPRKRPSGTCRNAQAHPSCQSRFSRWKIRSRMWFTVSWKRRSRCIGRAGRSAGSISNSCRMVPGHAHDVNPIAEKHRFLDGMGDEKTPSPALLATATRGGLHVHAGLRIQGHKGLVHEDDPRPQDQRSAIATRCLMPPESSCGYLSASVFTLRPTWPSHSRPNSSR